jgi:hypothetical protein
MQDFGWRQSRFNSVMAARVNGNPRSESIEVEAAAVDDWLGARGIVPAFIKIDAESAEHRMLRGLRRTIEQHHPILSLEIGDYNLLGAPSSAELIRSIVELGYDAFEYAAANCIVVKIADGRRCKPDSSSSHKDTAYLRLNSEVL